MSKKSLAAVMAVLALVLCGMSIYKDSRLAENADGTIVLRMAQTSSENGAIGQTMNLFADKIFKATNGRYKIETYHNGQLGGEIDTIEGCQMNTIDIAVVN